MPEKAETYRELLKERRNPNGALFSMTRFLLVLLAVFIIFIIIFTQILIGVQVCGPSMNPTLYGGVLGSDRIYRGGDYLFVNALDTPTYGDIIVFHSPDGSGKEIIKRVIGLPGDEISAENGVLYRTNKGGGQTIVDEPYIADGWTGSIKPYTVPDGMLYVLGDNRNDSTDSRRFGPVAFEDVLGVVTQWSYNCRAFLSDLFGFFRLT